MPGPGMSNQPRRGRRRLKQDRDAGRDGAAGSQDTGPGHAAALTAGRGGPGEHVGNVLAGIREPIVVILLLIAFFTSLSGQPLDGLLMLIVGVSLAWDGGHRVRAGPEGLVAATKILSDASLEAP